MTTPARGAHDHPLAGQGPTMLAVAVGGALGALARYGLGVAFPHGPGDFPLATFGINVVGCLLIGVVIVLLTEGPTPHPLARPFLTTGVLGGFTTFSTFATDVDQLLLAGHPGIAAGYLAATPVAAIAATWVGLRLTRAAGGWG